MTTMKSLFSFQEIPNSNVKKANLIRVIQALRSIESIRSTIFLFSFAVSRLKRCHRKHVRQTSWWWRKKNRFATKFFSIAAENLVRAPFQHWEKENNRNRNWSICELSINNEKKKKNLLSQTFNLLCFSSRIRSNERILIWRKKTRQASIFFYSTDISTSSIIWQCNGVNTREENESERTLNHRLPHVQQLIDERRP